MVRLESMFLCGLDARAQGLLLLAGNFDDGLRGSLLLGSQLQELMDEVGVFLGGLQSTARFMADMVTLRDDMGGVLGNLLVDLLSLFSGFLGGVLCFVGCFASLFSGVLRFLGQFLRAGVSSSLLSCFLSLFSQFLGFSSVMRSSLGGMLSVLLFLLQCFSLQLGEGLLARFLALVSVSGDSSSLGSAHSHFGEVLGLFLDLSCLLLVVLNLCFLGLLLSSLSLNLLGFGTSFLKRLGSLSLDLLHGSSFSGLRGFSSGFGLISSGVSSEESLSLLGVLFGKVLLHFSLESGFLGLHNLLSFLLLVNFVELFLADMNVLNNNLFPMDFLGDLCDLLHFGFLSFDSVSSLLDDLGHGCFGLFLRVMLSLVNGSLDSFLDEVGGLLLDSSNGLGSALLDDLSFGDGSLGLGFLLLKSLLCDVLQVGDGVLGRSLDSG